MVIKATFMAGYLGEKEAKGFQRRVPSPKVPEFSGLQYRWVSQQWQRNAANRA
jgi:hypothetical protein